MVEVVKGKERLPLDGHVLGLKDSGSVAAVFGHKDHGIPPEYHEDR